MRNASEARMDARLRFFIICVTLILLLCIGVSISEFRTAPKMPRQQVGLILEGHRGDAGWNEVQYTGLKAATKTLGIDLVVKEKVPSNIEAYRQAIKEFADRGIRKIVLTRHSYPPELRSLIRQYPKIVFVVQTTEISEDNTVSCSTRLFEVQHLAGLVAGMQTKTGTVGYVAPYSCVEVNRNLNAFVIGVKRANPSASVKVAWTGGWSSPDRDRIAVEKLSRAGADVLAYQEDGRAAADAAERLGIDYIDAHEPHPEHVHCISAIESDWENVYFYILRSHAGVRDLSNADNYYWRGFMHGVVSLEEFTDRVLPRTREIIEKTKRELMHGQHLIYGGEIYDMNGVKRCDAREVLSNEHLRRGMNWLIKGVEPLE